MSTNPNASAPTGWTESAIVAHIRDTFPGTEIVEANGDYFFFYDPDGTTDPTRRMPYATLVTGDSYDNVSNLNRPGVFRVNIGIGKAAYNEILGDPPARPGPSGLIETTHDLTALDQFMPHPFYGHMLWISVINPGPNTAEKTKSLLAEAYATAKKKHVG